MDSNIKIGQSPGALVYTGKISRDVQVPITHYIYDANGAERVDWNYDQEFAPNIVPGKVNWININGIHNVKLVAEVGKRFNIDVLILEDLLNHRQRPKFEDRDDFCFITMKMVSKQPHHRKISYEQISFIILKDTLITFQEHPNDVFDDIRLRIDKNVGRVRRMSVGYLAYRLIDRIVDNYFLVIESLEESVEHLEDRVIAKASKEEFKQIFQVKKDITIFRKATAPLKEITFKLINNGARELFGSEVEIYFNDFQDHVVIAHENTEILSSRANELAQLYHSSLGNSMNEIMKVLSMISTIFIPMSFIAGLYGMNFENMPELKWYYSYYVVLGAMGAVLIGSLYFFKQKKWW